MKKILGLMICFISFMLPVFADFNQNLVLPSETGIVEAVEYEDLPNLKQGENNIKQIVKVKIISGKFKGEERFIDNMLTGNPAYDIPLKKGNKVILHLESDVQEILTVDDVNFYIADIKRDNTVSLVGIIFFTLLLIIGRKKGIASLIAIAGTMGLIFFGLMPMILNGINPVLSAVIVGILSACITIYLVGGFNSKSTSALLGTVISLVLAAGISIGVIFGAKLTGFAGEENMFLYAAHPNLNFKGLLSASMLIAALGALMDTAVSIASTINEIYETDKTLSVKQLFVSGMNVGRDIIGTMSNTLILVYLGSSIPLVLLANNIDMQKFFNLNQVATEISSALIGSIAILACVPITAIISAYLIKRQKENIEFSFERLE